MIPDNSVPVTHRLRIVIMAHSLATGGAERQITQLAKGLDRDQFSVTVLLFHSGGTYNVELNQAGITTKSIGLSGSKDLFGFLIRTAKALRNLQPDVLYSFTDFPNVVAGLLGRYVKNCKIIWGVRASELDFRGYSFSWRVWRFLQRLMVNRADLIICNSQAGLEFLVNQNYSPERLTVIPNGISDKIFRPNAMASQRLRTELQIAKDDFIIGHVARLDPMKDHLTLLNAFRILIETSPRVRLICVGGGREKQAEDIKSTAKNLGIQNRFIWLGVRDDLADLYNVFDLFTLCSSSGEGFPNVVGEAMASGLPCVVTDVGDGRRIVGDSGIVVPRQQPETLAKAWKKIMELSPNQRRKIGAIGRQRVVNKFSIDRMVETTSRSIRSLL